MSFEETWIPSPKDALCQVWLKLAQWFWRRTSRFLKFTNVFSQFRNYFPLEKDGTLNLNKHESPSSKDALCQVWLKLAHWFWRRRWKFEKFTTMTTTRQQQWWRQTTDKFWSEKLTWAFCSGEQVSQKPKVNNDGDKMKIVITVTHCSTLRVLIYHTICCTSLST